MRKRILTYTYVILSLLLGVSTVWGADQKIYVSALQAQSSPASTGSGQVKLTWLDITGTPMSSNVAMSVQNPNPVGPSSSVQSLCATMFAMDGVEIAVGDATSQIYMTSFAYFQAEGIPDNGSYLADWTFVDPSIYRLDTIGEARGGVYFKLLPDTNNYAYYPSGNNFASAATYAQAHPNNVYAVFKKYLLSNPQASSGQLDATYPNSVSLSVSLDIEGDLSSFGLSDVGYIAFEDGTNTHSQWSYDMGSLATEVLSSNKMRVTLPVSFSTWDGISIGGYKTTLTVKIAGNNPSTLNIPLSVNALDPNRPQATLFDAKDSIASGTFDALLEKISTCSSPVIKLKRPQENISLSNKTFTLDLNGNTVGAMTVNSGEVTVAYSKYGGSATSLTVGGGKVILNGGTFGSLTINAGVVEQNGATITGAATNAGTLSTTEGTINGGLTSTGILTLNGGTFKGTTAVIISGGKATLNRATINGTTCGLQVTAGNATVEKLAAITGGTYSAQCTGGTLKVNCGKFGAPLNGTIDFTSGYFKNTNYGITAEGKTVMQLVTGVEYNEGYRYFLGTSTSAQENGVGVCRIGNVSYASLEDAIAYANNNPSVQDIVIFMTNDYVLPAGYYTLPANATIVVPMSDTQSKEVNKTAPRVSFHDMDRSHPYASNIPHEFRRLTFAKGVNMEVFGSIEMTCSQFASNEAYTGQPYGPYGHIVLEEGSHITLQAGSEIRAWGFMTGKGEVDARRDSKVREMFQMGDWKGAMTSVKITGMAPGFVADNSAYKIFPVSQYFIQNIESPVKYHPGAVLSTSAMVSEGLLGVLAVAMVANDIKIVGVNGRDEAIFLMDQKADAENTWVRKWYDAERDVQTYDINSAAQIGSMVLDMGELDMSSMLDGAKLPVKLNSAKFDLPITSNMKIHLLSGKMEFQQNTCLLPGAEVEVDKESIVTVSMSGEELEAKENGENRVFYTGALYVYDSEDWDKYAFCNTAVKTGNTWKDVKDTAYTKVVRYAQSWGGTPTIHDEQRRPADAAINVHGTFNTAEGYVYTSAHGANIFSTNEDAGTFIFNEDASEAGERTVYQVKDPVSNEFGGRFTDIEASEKTFYSARLKHGDGTYENTDAATEGDAYCYQEDKWTILREVPKNTCFMQDNHNPVTYYAKPADYVAVVATMDANDKLVGNDDHTYSDANGAGRLFILVDDCQWWEVEQKDNLYHCIHPDNDTYYYWDDSNHNSKKHKWAEKTFTITWKNWDGSIIQTIDKYGDMADSYVVTYGTQAEFLGTNPTREPNIDYTYDFTGWTPALGPVTKDVTYTATYTQKERKYTIIFCQEGGVEIERQFLTHNELPVCENMPTRIGYTLQWNPAIAAVTGDATYTATWLEEPPTQYAITFVDYDGTTVLQSGNVNVGEIPVFNGTLPANKPATSEYTYVFDHWAPEIAKVTQAMTYTAVYREEPKLYTITFKDENNSLIETKKYQYGETPVCSNPPTKAADAEWTYTLSWIPQIQTVMGDAEYKADFDTYKTKNKYTVSVKCSPSGAATVSGSGLYEYGAMLTIAYAANDGYEFVNWTNAEGIVVASLPTTVTGDISLVANFNCPTCDNVTITWNDFDGTLLKSVSQAKGTATTYTGATPTRAATTACTYTFDGWSTTANGELVYKNGMTPKAAEGGATYYAHYATQEIPNLVIPEDGAPVVIESPVTYQNLVITSNGETSGQLLGINYLTLTGEAYFDFAINAKSRRWYAVAVPWEVDAQTGISIHGRTLGLGKDFDLLYYDGNDRAVNGTNKAWLYVENDADKTMQPGRLYMIALLSDAPVIRFKAKDKSHLLNTSVHVEAYPSAVATDANWNGIGNPAIFHAFVNAGTANGQVYDADKMSYELVRLNSTKLVVGQAVFVQAPNDDNVSVAYGGSFAPARRNRSFANSLIEYEVRIANSGHKYTNRIFVQLDETKEEDSYTIGKDLVKMGVSSQVPQLWVEAYDTKLCVNTQAPTEGKADYALGIFAPQTGEYTISIKYETGKEDATLYLTYDGEAIWNLAQNAYIATLQQGTTQRYGLRVVMKAPQVATGVDEAIVDSKDTTANKVLIGNQVYIIREGNVYTVTGQLVK